MAKVLGIGGFFIKSRDPAKLAEWYRDALGLDIEDWGGAQLWSRADAPAHYAVWSPFKDDTTYFAPSTREVMLNLRVDDLDAMLAQLRAKDARVLDRREDSGELGKFGYVMDPDGTLIELWEPAQRDSRTS
jgi:predicted enzyme related to lactoylglutathione lyase